MPFIYPALQSVAALIALHMARLGFSRFRNRHMGSPLLVSTGKAPYASAPWSWPYGSWGCPTTVWEPEK
ncbi:hypothetical protein JCM14722_20130 [Pseudodesulfovibrio portus]|uniref:Uncharacterized protein n=1 Tax=Pseudodesulfovibrio portus TaxID=231439 RepID=A0ABN6RX61_9BACT|nr:hypothetical protein JCM14722_20130 [Pseudodesulfovibrio portus]